ncbi:hypothetical protein NMY22_g1633 [Coprinellus aureogranulatus]|nr:hypothetical protein NMY22_g1633 [Coprinellus aureogranulatus]
MLSRIASSSSWQGLLSICRHASSAPSSRLHTTDRRRFRYPKTFTFAGKSPKKAMSASPAKKSVKRRVTLKDGDSSSLQEMPKGISTLRAEKLSPSDWIRASGRECVWPHFRALPVSGKARAIWYGYHNRYPSDATGFFYFSRPDPLPHPAAGHFRFRVVPKPDPTLFSAGYDLVEPETGMVWGKHLLHLILNRTDRHLYNVILKEGIITPEEDRRIRDMLPKSRQALARGQRSLQVLDSILDPFIVDFSRTSFHLLVADPDRVYEINKPHRWANDAMGPIPSPYSGLGLCEFVLLDGTPKPLGIRLLRYLKPPRPEDIVKQVEGTLIKRYSAAVTKKTESLVTKSAKLLSEHSYRLLLDRKL